MTRPASPPRLYVYLAPKAPLGVVLRRGPSEWARLSLWRTDTDAFEHGQWLRGRVYEPRCDVSDDGSLFVYFARKEAGGPDLDADSWMAISRPPWFTALALWAIGGTQWLGGCFTGGDALFLGGVTGPPDRGELPPWLRLTADLPYFDRTPDATSRSVYFSRLLRDGWTPVPSADAPKATWERRPPGGTRTLLMAPALDAWFDTSGGRHVADYALSSGMGDLHVLGRATWADWDQRGRLIIAQDGRLYEVEPEGGRREIADFNAQTPDLAPSPAWARGWPERPRR